MTAKVTFTIRDYSDELSPVAFYLPDVTALNFDDTLTKVLALNVAMIALTKGNIVGVQLNIDTGFAGTDERPNDAFAQREIGLRLYHQDTVNGFKSYVTVACADLDIVAQPGTDDIDLSLSLVAPLVTAIENLAVSKTGDPIEIYRGRVVGRSS